MTYHGRSYYKKRDNYSCLTYILVISGLFVLSTGNHALIIGVGAIGFTLMWGYIKFEEAKNKKIELERVNAKCVHGTAG